MKKILGLIIISVICFGLGSCVINKPVKPVVNPNLTDEEKVLEAIEKVEVPKQIHQGISLPIEYNEVKITWTCDEPLVFDTEKVFYAASEYLVELVGVFSYNNLDISNTYTITIEPGKNVGCDYAWNYFSKKIPTSTAGDFTLHDATKKYNGCTATYRSTNLNSLSNDGKLSQTLKDEDVLFLTYINNGSITMIYPKTVKVLGYIETQRISLAEEWLLEQIDSIGLAEGTKFPDYCEEFGVYINWYSLELGLITANGTIIRPLTKKDVTFGCTLACGDTNKSLTFNLKDYGGNMTELDIFKQWCEGSIQTSLRGTVNYADPEDDHFLDQNRTNSYGVLNLTVGAPVEIDTSYLIDVNTATHKYFGSGYYGTNTHPAVSQEKLDELFYEGYKMPNDKNILWIVVHESGMPKEKNNAELLAQIQVRNAKQGGREASWNYQVDEGKIYQSFDDSIVCWHASDGTRVEGGGNNNGIGIEMCINSDGNYEGAMRLDAKLIAQLMYKYNLTLDNVKRHFDFAPDKKQCPYYMIETNRWTEFLELVNREYIAHKYYQEGVRFEWTVTDEEGNDALSKYFIHYGQGLYTNKPVSTEVVLTVTLTATYEGKTYTFSKKLKLLPEGSETNE